MVKSGIIVVGFAVVLVGVAVLGITSYVNTQRLIESNRQLTHTYETIEDLEDIQLALGDAEAGQRGYILTGQEYYLQPYHQAVSLIQERLGKLTELSEAHPDRQTEIDQLKALTAARLEDLQDTIDLCRKSGLEAALPVIATGRGKQAMDDARELITQINMRERQSLQLQQGASDAAARSIMLTIAGGIPLSLIVLAAAAIIFMRTGSLGVAVFHPTAKVSRWVGIVSRFMFALVAVALAVLVRRWLLSIGPLPLFITFFPAVLLVATVSGGGPGILATILSGLAADYWFIVPRGSFSIQSPGDILAMTIFACTSLTLCILAERLRRSNWAEAFGLAKQQEAEELAKKNRELARMAEELSRSNRDLEQFAYVASHDLQEPLRQVRSFVDLLKERYGDRLDGKAAQYFGFIHDGAARMSDLISGLLAYSRAGAREKTRKGVSCDTALNAALANLQASITETGARITRDGLPTVTADPIQLAQLFQNLVGNAIKFRREQIPPEIHVSYREIDNESVFSVRDNGIGIAPEHYERIFQIFQRLHGRDTHEGTGIGLAICKKIVEQHGGRIWVESKLNEGSTFCFTLPEEDGRSR